MSSVYKRINVLLFLCGLTLGLMIAWLGQPVFQWGVQSLFRKQFYELTASCDAAMRTHLIAKNRLDLEPSETAVRAVRSAELGLLACQDYDLLRKRLIRIGLDENALSELTLSFAEARASDLQLVVETHEFRY